MSRFFFIDSKYNGQDSQIPRYKEAFKQGEVDLLVCTDVAARGLDIKDVPRRALLGLPS